MNESREFTVLIEQDPDGWYVAEVPSLKSCYTQARTLDELMDRVREVIALCLEEERSVSGPLRFVGVRRVAL